jgi:hypothetical protein
MNDRQDIDARIDASLAAHVRAQRLDQQFDAAVWRRIEAQKHQKVKLPGAPARSAGAARWLRAANAASVLVAAILLAYFGSRLGGGVMADLSWGATTAEPLAWLTPAYWVVTVCALGFGLRFTALGRWLRAELS